MVVAEDAVEGHIPFKLDPAVPGHEEFDGIAVEDDHTCPQHEFPAVIEVPQGDEMFESERFTERDRQNNHHGKSGEYRSGDEVRGHDGVIPSWNLRNSEVQGDGAVH